MKTFIVALVALSVAGLALADQPITKPSANEQTAKILKNNAQIDALQRQIDKARTQRNTALWVGIPASLILGGLGVYYLGKGATSGAPGEPGDTSSTGFKFTGTAVVTAAGTVYLVHLKGKQIDQFKEALNQLRKQNEDSLAGLKDSKD